MTLGYIVRKSHSSHKSRTNVKFYLLQEGYNARTNRALKQTHPSPGILLCHIRNEIKLAEQKLAQARVGIEKPRKQPKTLTQEKRRLQMKKIYEVERELDSFLSGMGHSVMAANLSGGRSNDLKETTNRRTSLVYENRQALNVSTWIPTLEKDISVMEPGENPYEDRQIGVRKKQEWVGKKCASCAKGFNRVSKPLQCFTCDSYTHPKPACMVVSSNESQYLCKKCDNSANRTDKVQKETRTKILTCEHCDYSSTLSFNMKRHLQRNHRNNKKDYAEKTLSNLLEAEGLSNLKGLFQKEDISLQMLLEMNNADIRRMIEDLGISWGQKYRIEKLVEKEKKQCSSWH